MQHQRPAQNILAEPSGDRREFLKALAHRAAAIGVLPAGLALSEHAASAAPVERPIIDAHMHVWANDPRRYPFPHPYVKDYQGMPHEGTVEMLIEDMDRHGCTHCVLVQTICHGWDNTYLADCVKRFPARFKGHGLIDPTDAKVADKLEFWTKEHGLHGMRFSPIYYQNGNHGGDGWLDAEETHRLWRKAEQLGSVLNFYIGPKQLPKLEKDGPGSIRTCVPLSTIFLKWIWALRILSRISNCCSPWRSIRTSGSRFPELSSAAKSHQYPFTDAYPYVKPRV